MLTVRFLIAIIPLLQFVFYEGKVMNIFVCIGLCFLLSTQSSVNSALLPPLETLEKMWRVGYERATTDKTLYRARKPARKPLGRMNGITVSWVTFLHPRLIAFEKGFNARKSSLNESEQAASRAALAGLAQDSEKQIYFHGEIGIYPKFHGGRKANPEHLRDVRVEMRVGERTYLPKKQPGDLGPEIVHDIHKYTIPGTTDEDGNQISPDTVVEEKYIRYEGTFDVSFDLYDNKGNPAITSNDEEISLFVIGKFGRQKSTFRLKDWLNYYEK